MTDPRIPALLRKLEHLVSIGADPAKIAELKHDLRNLGHDFDAKPAAVPDAAPAGRQAPERVTAEPPAKPTAAPAPVKRGPGRPRKVAK